MAKYKTGDKCPKSGYWEQIETCEQMWHEKGDEFPPYYEKVGEDKNGTPLFNQMAKRAHYQYINQTKQEGI